jgi:hypothetical protein
MSLRLKLWWIGGVIYMLINLGGVAYAIAFGQGMHGAVHVVLLVVGAVLMWRLPRRDRSDALTAQPAHNDVRGKHVTDERLELLQQSVDAVALEVERIGEAQRFREKLEAQRVEKPR